jgi:hypothetical protein
MPKVLNKLTIRIVIAKKMKLFKLSNKIILHNKSLNIIYNEILK